MGVAAADGETVRDVGNDRRMDVVGWVQAK